MSGIHYIRISHLKYGQVALMLLQRRCGLLFYLILHKFPSHFEKNEGVERKLCVLSSRQSLPFQENFYNWISEDEGALVNYVTGFSTHPFSNYGLDGIVILVAHYL